MSTAIATKTDYTPEDLLKMPDSKSYELVNGQLVERKMGVKSSWVATRLSSASTGIARKMASDGSFRPTVATSVLHML